MQTNICACRRVQAPIVFDFNFNKYLYNIAVYIHIYKHTSQRRFWCFSAIPSQATGHIHNNTFAKSWQFQKLYIYRYVMKKRSVYRTYRACLLLARIGFQYGDLHGSRAQPSIRKRLPRMLGTQALFQVLALRPRTQRFPSQWMTRDQWQLTPTWRTWGGNLLHKHVYIYIYLFIYPPILLYEPIYLSMLLSSYIYVSIYIYLSIYL